MGASSPVSRSCLSSHFSYSSNWPLCAALKRPNLSSMAARRRSRPGGVHAHGSMVLATLARNRPEIASRKSRFARSRPSLGLAENVISSRSKMRVAALIH